MKNFAILNDENKITSVIVIDDADVNNNGGDFSVEAENFVKQLLKINNIKQYASDGSIRYNAACIGGEYDAVNDAFIYPKPFESWTLNNQFKWESPIPYPDDGSSYVWNEATQSWDLAQ